MVKKSIVALLVGLSTILWFCYYSFHFKWRDCFDQQGRCFDTETGGVYLEQSGIFWLPLALLATGLTIYGAWRSTR